MRKNLSTQRFLITSFVVSFFFAMPTQADHQSFKTSPIDSEAFLGSISFSTAEIAMHKTQITKLINEAASCTRDAHTLHLDFFAKWGISPFFGDNSNYARMTAKQKVEYVESLNLPASLTEQLQPMSCIGLVYKCLKVGFEKTGQSAVWARLFAYTQKNAGDGSALQFALQKLGWKVYFWNPDPTKNKLWDDLEYKEDPQNDDRFWGYHSYRFQTVNSTKRNYLYNTVDDARALVGFKRSVPTLLQNSPFYIGNAHSGYHIFIGLKDRIVEGHSTIDITNPRMLEDNVFDPLNEDSPGPSGSYRSGLMALPPSP